MRNPTEHVRVAVRCNICLLFPLLQLIRRARDGILGDIPLLLPLLLQLMLLMVVARLLAENNQRKEEKKKEKQTVNAKKKVKIEKDVLVIVEI